MGSSSISVHFLSLLMNVECEIETTIWLHNYFLMLVSTKPKDDLSNT